MKNSLCFRLLPQLDGGGRLAVQGQRDLEVPGVHADRVPQAVVDPVTCGERRDAMSETPVHLSTISSAGAGGSTPFYLDAWRRRPSISPKNRRCCPAERENSPDSPRSSPTGKQKEKPRTSSSAVTPCQQSFCRIYHPEEKISIQKTGGNLLNFGFALFILFFFFLFAKPIHAAH